MRFTIAAIAFLLLDAAVPFGENTRQLSDAKSERLCLVDEGPSVADFATFRAALESAIRERNISRFLSHVASDVGMEGRNNRGRRAIARLYDLQNPKASFWRELEEILSLGGRFIDGDRFCAPYMGCGFAPGDATQVVILGADVPAYERPTTTSRVLMRLSCDLLTAAEDDRLPPIPSDEPSLGFTTIYLPIGQWGWVQSSLARSPASYSAHFAKRGGRWQLVDITAGD